MTERSNVLGSGPNGLGLQEFKHQPFELENPYGKRLVITQNHAIRLLVLLGFLKISSPAYNVML
ncbi:MAG: hypothetical protein WC501_04995 [Candidatus Micrarchaeia archaeon]